MIRFLDLETKKVFNGSKPYVFEIGKEGASTGKWVSETVMILSEFPELSVSFPEDSLYWLADLSSPETIEVNMHEYTDLDSIKTHSLTLEGVEVQSSGVSRFLYRVPVLFMCDSESEWHDFMTVTENGPGGTTEDFEFSVDAYSEDERLPIDLSNEGFEMPKQFQKAVYDSNVRDESEDYILLNRKWKELLIEYWNVLANKGSYESLINSLKFFEYGDLVRISEYWKYVDQFGTDILIGRDIEQILDSGVREYLDVLSKTTYIGLNLTVNTIKSRDYIDIPEGTENLDTDKFIPEPVPELEYLSLKWSIEDLTLKMALLANYFSTYFMPIHLDLIHATVDRLVFTTCIKILKNVRRKRQDWWDDCEPIECSLSTDTEFWLVNTKDYNYPDTVLRNSDTPAYWGDLTRIGMDPSVENRITFSEDNSEEIQKYLNQYFGGVGVTVPVEIRFHKGTIVKNSGISIYRQEDASNYTLTANYTSYQPVYGDSLEFSLVFVKSGRYLVQLQLTDENSSTRTGSWYITVHGTSANGISIKRLRKIDYTSVEASDKYNDWFYKNLDFNSFMFTEAFAEQIKYKQWLVRSDGSSIDGIGMNQLLVIDCGATGFDRPIVLTCNGETKTFEFSLDIAQELSEAYPHYWWKLMVRSVAKKSRKRLEITEEKRYYIVGVRKYFDTVEEDTREIFSDYVKSWKDGELESLDAVLAVYTRTNNRFTRGILEITAPVGSTVTIDRFKSFVTVSETSTIPLKNEKTDITIDYSLAGHLFHRTFRVDDMRMGLGRPEYIVHSAKAKGFTTIEESRFFPVFHKLEDIDTVAKTKDIVVCIPDFRWVDKQVENTCWEFVNATTGEIFWSKSFKEDYDSGEKLYIQEPFISKYDFKNSLTKGYYDVVLHYTMGGTENTQTVLSAFRLE